MRPLSFPLLADENIHPDVIRELASQGKEIVSVPAERLAGQDDLAVLRRAHAGGRVVLTHDADFGTLAVRAREPYTGIIYLRPGHILPAVTLGSLRAIESLSIDVVAPFILVAERRDDIVRVRVRG